MADSSAVTARAWYADWRVWIGVAFTCLCLWVSLRNVPLAEVGDALAGANLWILVGLSAPAHCLQVYVRALRWRYLTEPIKPISRGDLYRAQSVGFMTNNLVPLRIGELVRVWFLARQTRTEPAQILGTVVVERVIDVIVVLLMAGLGFALVGVGEGGNEVFARGAKIMAPAAVVPVIGLVVLRTAPAFVKRVAEAATRPLSPRLADLVEAQLDRFLEGLGALHGGTHLLWIAWHSFVSWFLLSAVPMAAAMLAVGIDLGSLQQWVSVSWIVLAALGVAVALPSAPGFVGPYQGAFVLALAPFGIDRATAFAVGALAWVVFWVTLVVQGLVALRWSGVGLSELRAGPPEESEGDAPAVS